MASAVPIKWRKVDTETIRNLARRVNAKITRVSKNLDLAPVQPERIKVDELVNELKGLSRAEFNRRVKSYNRYMNKGAEKLAVTKAGTVTTQWQLREVQYSIQSINAQARNELKRRNIKLSDDKMDSIHVNELRPRVNNAQSINPEYWNKYVRSVEKQIKGINDPKRLEQYKLNYLKAVEQELGTDNKLYRLLVNVPAQQMVDAYYSDPAIFEIGFVYGPKEAEEKIEVLYNNWTDFLGE